MSAIKEKIFDLAERVQELLDSGIKDNEIDEYMEQVCTPDEYSFYHSHKDIIFDMLGYMSESLNESLDSLQKKLKFYEDQLEEIRKNKPKTVSASEIQKRKNAGEKNVYNKINDAERRWRKAFEECKEKKNKIKVRLENLKKKEKTNESLIMLRMNEFLNESFEDWFEENQESDILRDEYEKYLFDNEDMDIEPLSFEDFCRQKYEWDNEYEGELEHGIEFDMDDDIYDDEEGCPYCGSRHCDGNCEEDDEEDEDDEEWIDPAGGTHYGNEDDPARQYESLIMPRFSEYIKSLNEGKYDQSESHPMDDLKANFRSWEIDENDAEDVEELVQILQSRHPDFDPLTLRKMAYDWCGVYSENIEEDCD